MMNKKLLALALLIGFAVSAHADEFLDKRWYVAPFGSYVNPGGDRISNNEGAGAGLGVGKIIDEHFNVELRGFYNGFDDESTKKNRQWTLAGGTADVQYYFWRDKFSPYTVAALGGMNSQLGKKNAAGFIGEVGAGFTYEIFDNLLFRSDVRYRYNNNFDANLTPTRHTNEYHDMVVNVGFVIPLGPKPVAAAPAAEPVVECSTLDSDADGVNDCIDTCPGTISGSKVDGSGCPVSLELKGVNFEYDSAQLTPNSMAILDGVAEGLMASQQKNDIDVRGHTSSEGSSRYNMRLSQRRSQSVVDYLSSKGVTNRLTAHGYGESMPIADNSTEEGRQQNRRVELVWGQ